MLGVDFWSDDLAKQRAAKGELGGGKLIKEAQKNGSEPFLEIEEGDRDVNDRFTGM